MPTTTNYGWVYPSNTDLVTNGAAQMQTIATSIDTTLYAETRRIGGRWTQSQGMNSTWSNLGWGTETFDTDNFIVAGASNRIFTIPANQAGLYQGVYRINQGLASGTSQHAINWITAAYGSLWDVAEAGAAIGALIPTGATNSRGTTIGTQWLAVGDTITVWARTSASATGATHEFLLMKIGQ